jgi:hypothetical protein
VKDKSIHIIILALFHLLVFITPISVKSEHTHAQKNNCVFNSSPGKIISKATKPCPICQFEFVHFITSATKQYDVFQIAKPLKNSKLVSVEINFPFTSFSHRAPPVS